MKKPNFFIIGAPKCGTTSLASWLTEHPEVYMSPIKEPDYFHTKEQIGSLKEYEELFSGANDSHKAVGEASVRYLYSDVAVPNILRYSTGKTKFIVMIRNPIEMAPSLHSQRVYSLNENEPNFEKAWRLQNEDMSPRKDLPINCYTPEINNYGPICKMGEQLERLFKNIDHENCKIILMDDLKSNPREVWLDLLIFLGVKDNGKKVFEIKNKSKKVHSIFLKNLHRKLGKVKTSLGIKKNFAIGRYFTLINESERERPLLSDSLRYELQKYFQNDIQRLERILSRDLSHWK